MPDTIVRCKNCKYWKISEWVGPQDKQICFLSISGSGEAMNSTLAFAGDADNEEAWLVTDPEFGCVQFEPSLSYYMTEGHPSNKR